MQRDLSGATVAMPHRRGLAPKDETRIHWEPAVYEHKAALIGRSPMSVSRSAKLLTVAALEELEVYSADAVTIGIDVYNVEPEAIGAVPVALSANSCPVIPNPPWRLSELPRELELPSIEHSGRFALVLEAAARVRESVSVPGACVRRLSGLRAAPVIRVAASGPISIAGNLVGAQDLLIAMASGNPEATRLIEYCAAVSDLWTGAIRDAGHDVALYDSAASPPLLSPGLYRSNVKPHHRRLMNTLKRRKQQIRPLIMGGDTSRILRDIVDTGANAVVVDYPASVDDVLHALLHDTQTLEGLTIRRNIDPRELLPGAKRVIPSRLIEELTMILSTGAAATIGTGILPYAHDFNCTVEVVSEVLTRMMRYVRC